MAELLKHRLAKTAIERIASVLSRIHPEFAESDFIQQSLDGLDALELKERVQHIITVLAHHLDTDFAEAALILQQIPNHWQANTEQGDYGFAAWPLIDYVAVYGLQHPEIALQTLKTLTPLFTAEFAIRPFLHHHFDLTYGYLQQWALDESHHVRRLASEGCRPRLPWGQRVPYLMTHPEAIITILEQLKDDDSDYVRRSVANSLNDISKDYPDVVVRLAQQWLAQPTAHRQAIIKHATRGLVKSGHADALAMLGYSQAFNLENVSFTLNKTEISMDETVQLSLSFLLPEPQNLVIDYALHLPRANGKKSIKVFKWRTGLLAAGQHQLTQNYSFKVITTRRYYLGEHDFEVLVNGQSLGLQSIALAMT
jgi:3-methyladenine DNA glycosylase AlkC